MHGLRVAAGVPTCWHKHFLCFASFIECMNAPLLGVLPPISCCCPSSGLTTTHPTVHQAAFKLSGPHAFPFTHPGPCSHITCLILSGMPIPMFICPLSGL